MEVEILNNKDANWQDNKNIEYPIEFKITIDNSDELDKLNRLSCQHREFYLSFFKAYHCSDIFTKETK